MFKFLRRFQKSEDLDKRLVFGLSKGRVPKLSQLKLLPKVLSAYELWILRIAGAILLAFAVAGISIFVIRHRSVTPQSGGTYREAFPGSPRPQFSKSTAHRRLVPWEEVLIGLVSARVLLKVRIPAFYQDLQIFENGVKI